MKMQLLPIFKEISDHMQSGEWDSHDENVWEPSTQNTLKHYAMFFLTDNQMKL